MADYVTQKELNDFALSMEAVVKDLRAENKALKKQLSALPQAEETLSKLMTATDQAQSMHGVMMTERKQAAEQSIQNREAIKAEIDSAFARLKNTKDLGTRQLEMMYEANAENAGRLEEMRSLEGQMRNYGDSLSKREETVITNIDSRYENFDRAAGNEYLRQLHEQDAHKRSNQEINEEVQRQLRLAISNPELMGAMLAAGQQNAPVPPEEPAA